MERIIVDSYIKGEKPIWGDDPNDTFNQKILAVNAMYGWLYEQGILRAVSFEFKDYSFGTCFALDVNDLVPYRGAMEAARVERADLAVRHIFDELYTPCMYSGAITLSSPMASYRDVDGCVGRSWECGLIQGLGTKAIHRVLEARNTEGVVAAAKTTFAEFGWRESDLYMRASLDEAVKKASMEKALQNAQDGAPVSRGTDYISRFDDCGRV